MANNLLNEAFGIDATIQQVQIDLYSELSNVLSGEIEGYGKVYRNPINTGVNTPEAYARSKIITPEWFNSETQDYDDVYFDDNKACTFFFIPSEDDSSEDGYLFTNRTKVVVMADLDRIYPENKQRLDTKLQQDVVQILNKIAYMNYVVVGLERRIESIFREFSSKVIKLDNMNKHHIFSVTIDLTYNINNKCN